MSQGVQTWRFPRMFWTGNVAELCERAAYYGTFIALRTYLIRVVGLDDVQAGITAGMFGGWIYLVPFFTGAIADRMGFRNALMLAFALNWPNTPIYIWGIFPVKAKWMVGFLFVVSVMSAFGGSGDGIAHFAHLGGIVTGFFYLKSGWRPGASASPGRSRVRVRKMAIVPRKAPRQEEAPRERSTEGWKPEEDAMLDEVDRILDKISAHGMSSLTPEERETLDNMSKRRQSN